MSFNPAIEAAVSTPRFDWFRAAANDDEHAWKLYRWNIELTSSFLVLAADLEVALRNTVHEQLADLYGTDQWWANPSLLLDDITADMLVNVVRRYRKQLDKGSVGAGKVISELSLGTWVRLLSKGGHSALGRPSTTTVGSGALLFGAASLPANSTTKENPGALPGKTFTLAPRHFRS